MRNKNKITTAFFFLILYSAALLPSFCAADSSSAGTKTGTFLKIATGARAAAMGEAFTATADDAFAQDWNPAAVTNIKYKSVAMMHSMYIADTSLSYLAYGENTGDMGAWGIAAKYMNYGSLAGMDEHGSESSKFSPFDLSLSIAFSCYVTGFNKDPEERFIMGAAGKFISSKIYEADNTLSADIGILSPWFFNRSLRLAFSGQNLIGSMRYDKEKNDLPLVLRGGAILKLSNVLILTSDIIGYNDYDPVFAAGGELNIEPSKDLEISLRAGLNNRLKDSNAQSSGNISFGAGIKFNDVYSIDYAFSPLGDLGSVHRFSLSVNFKPPVVIKKRRRGT